MIRWLRNLFRPTPVPTWNLFFENHEDGARTELGQFSGDGDEALEVCMMRAITKNFQSGSPKPLIGAYGIEPVRSA